jgi:hypothetical protein
MHSSDNNFTNIVMGKIEKTTNYCLFYKKTIGMLSLEDTDNNCKSHTQLKNERELYLVDQGRRRKDAVVVLDWTPRKAPHVKPQMRQLDLAFMPSFDDDVEAEIMQQLNNTSVKTRQTGLRQIKRQLGQQKKKSVPKSIIPVPRVEDT